MDEQYDELMEEGNTYLELLDKLKSSGAEIAELKARIRELTSHVAKKQMQLDEAAQILTKAFNDLNTYVFYD